MGNQVLLGYARHDDRHFLRLTVQQALFQIVGLGIIVVLFKRFRSPQLSYEIMQAVANSRSLVVRSSSFSISVAIS